MEKLSDQLSLADTSLYRGKTDPNFRVKRQWVGQDRVCMSVNQRLSVGILQGTSRLCTIGRVILLAGQRQSTCFLGHGTRRRTRYFREATRYFQSLFGYVGSGTSPFPRRPALIPIDDWK